MTAVTKTNGITTFRLSPKELDRWMHQNKAAFAGSFIEGCLLDNFTLVCRRGFAAVYEHYLNPWTSDYRIEFAPKAAQPVWQNWYKFEDSAAKV